MKKIGIFYWPLKGNVERTAEVIAKKFEGYSVEIFSLDKVVAEDLFKFDYLIFGNSTVGASHWEDATDDNNWYLMFHDVEQKNMDFKNKKIALYSLGDQVNYPHNFVDSLQLVYSHFKGMNASIVGRWPNKGYEFKESQALDGDEFVGLVLDLDNQEETLEPYTTRWVEMLKKEFV